MVIKLLILFPLFLLPLPPIEISCNQILSGKRCSAAYGRIFIRPISIIISFSFSGRSSFSCLSTSSLNAYSPQDKKMLLHHN